MKVFLGALILAACFTKPAFSQSDIDLEDCIAEGAFLGRQTIGSIQGHGFNCKGLGVQPSVFNNGEYLYSAPLSHRRGEATDDQLWYSFAITKDGEIRDFDLRTVKSGGILSGFTPGQGSLLKALFPVLAAHDWYLEANELTRVAGWEQAAFVLAASVANAAQESFQISMTGKRREPGQFEWMIDRPGGDYRRFAVSGQPAAGAVSCSASCLSEQQCKAWTYVRRGIQGSSAQCWLKNSIPNPRPMAGVVSGVKSNLALPLQPNQQ